jgi:hypothetical protein
MLFFPGKRKGTSEIRPMLIVNFAALGIKEPGYVET